MDPAAPLSGIWVSSPPPFFAPALGDIAPRPSAAPKIVSLRKVNHCAAIDSKGGLQSARSELRFRRWRLKKSGLRWLFGWKVPSDNRAHAQWQDPGMTSQWESNVPSRGPRGR